MLPKTGPTGPETGLRSGVSGVSHQSRFGTPGSVGLSRSVEGSELIDHPTEPGLLRWAEDKPGCGVCSDAGRGCGSHARTVERSLEPLYISYCLINGLHMSTHVYTTGDLPDFGQLHDSDQFSIEPRTP